MSIQFYLPFLSTPTNKVFGGQPADVHMQVAGKGGAGAGSLQKPVGCSSDIVTEHLHLLTLYECNLLMTAKVTNIILRANSPKFATCSLFSYSSRQHISEYQ